MNNFPQLRRVCPIDVPAPEVHPSDKRWSEVWDLVADLLQPGGCYLGVCAVLRGALDRLRAPDTQLSRMRRYVAHLLGGYGYLDSWVEDQNPGVRLSDPLMNDLRVAWCRQLARQFRAAGN